MNNAEKTIIVTGAGSGVGRAVAIRFAKEGWTVALVGRRREPLEETARLASGSTRVCPCDVGDSGSVKTVVESLGGLDALVNSAGINIPERSWDVVSAEDYISVLATNLNGAFNFIKASLPSLRERRGTVVNINSEAGRRATAKAGVAYVTSKFALAGMTESLLAEERENGVRAVSIFPGDINTPLLDKRPKPPPADIRTSMVQPEDIADCVWLAVNLPGRACIEELVIRPTIRTS